MQPSNYIEALEQLQAEGFIGDVFTEVVKRVHGITDPNFKLEGKNRQMIKQHLYFKLYSTPVDLMNVLRSRKVEAVTVPWKEVKEK